jgi:hypothetical protein
LIFIFPVNVYDFVDPEEKIISKLGGMEEGITVIFVGTSKSLIGMHGMQDHDGRGDTNT